MDGTGSDGFPTLEMAEQPVLAVVGLLQSASSRPLLLILFYSYTPLKTSILLIMSCNLKIPIDCQ